MSDSPLVNTGLEKTEPILEAAAAKLFSVRDEDASVLELGPEFVPEKAQPLFLSEASYLLERKVEQHQGASFQGDINPVLKKAFEYANRFDAFRSGDMAMTVRDFLSKVEPALHPFEIAQLATLVPEDSDEAKVVIPSLRDKFDDDKLQEIVSGLCRFRKQVDG
jgi:DNA-directed RNA polymerase II subunit RPB4